MKALRYFVVFSCALLLGTLNAQDTLVTMEGKVLTGRIIEYSSDYTSYIVDTTAKEASMVSSQNFILIKQGSIVLKSYKSDTLITKEGKIIPCKIVEIEPSNIAYFQYTNRVGNLQSLLKDNVLLAKFSDGTSERFDALTAATYSQSSFELGREDAKLYYKPPTGMIVGEVFLGLTHVIMASAVAGTVIAYIPPTKLSSVNNPNNFKISTDAAYKDGYLTVAKKKKRVAGSAGFLSGMAAFWGTVLIAIFYF